MSLGKIIYYLGCIIYKYPADTRNIHYLTDLNVLKVDTRGNLMYPSKNNLHFEQIGVYDRRL